MTTIPILWLSDPTAGAGKSGVAWELFMQTCRGGVKTALVDLEYLGMFAPSPEGDSHNGRLKVQLFASMWPQFNADGVRCLIAFTTSGVGGVGQSLHHAIPGSVVTTCLTHDANTPPTDDDAEVDLLVDATDREHTVIAEEIRASAGNWPFPDLEQ